jgi:hypothetical protein
MHVKPPWADPDFTEVGSYAALYWAVASIAVILAVVLLAAARRTPRIIEAAAVFVGTFVLAGVVLAATDPKPVTGTATVEGLPGQPSLASGSVECLGQSGQVTQIYANDWRMGEGAGLFARLLVNGLTGEPPDIYVEISQGSGFIPLEGQPSTAKLADAWVRGRAVFPYEVAAGPGVLTFTWDCGQAPVLSPITSFLWWITGDPLLPGFVVGVALVSLSAGLWWSRRRGGATPS